MEPLRGEGWYCSSRRGHCFASQTRLSVSWSFLRIRSVSCHPFCAKAKQGLDDTMQAAPICCRHSCHARLPLWRGAVSVRECQPSRAKPHPLCCLIMSECHLALPPLLSPHTQETPELGFPTPGLQNGRSQIGPDASHPSMC